MRRTCRSPGRKARSFRRASIGRRASATVSSRRSSTCTVVPGAGATARRAPTIAGRSPPVVWSWPRSTSARAASTSIPPRTPTWPRASASYAPARAHSESIRRASGWSAARAAVSWSCSRRSRPAPTSTPAHRSSDPTARSAPPSATTRSRSWSRSIPSPIRWRATATRSGARTTDRDSTPRGWSTLTTATSRTRRRWPKRASPASSNPAKRARCRRRGWPSPSWTTTFPRPSPRRWCAPGSKRAVRSSAFTSPARATASSSSPARTRSGPSR